MTTLRELIELLQAEVASGTNPDTAVALSYDEASACSDENFITLEALLDANCGADRCRYCGHWIDPVDGGVCVKCERQLEQGRIARPELQLHNAVELNAGWLTFLREFIRINDGERFARLTGSETVTELRAIADAIRENHVPQI
jgi:hypothetical protein